MDEAIAAPFMAKTTRSPTLLRQRMSFLLSAVKSARPATAHEAGKPLSTALSILAPALLLSVNQSAPSGPATILSSAVTEVDTV
ncbi:MAG: hypothetical protein V9G24_05870 [Rhodoblastus sp.]